MKIEEQNLEFVYLHRRKWVEAEMYPYLTLLGQSLGSVWLGEFPRPQAFRDVERQGFWAAFS